jgi:hypothetical protein
MVLLDVEARHHVKDCILRSLQKLNDRDTQRTGTEELREIFEVRWCLGMPFCGQLL